MHVQPADLHALCTPQLLDGPSQFATLVGEAEAAMAVVRERLAGAVLLEQNVRADADAGPLARRGVLARPLQFALRVQVHIGAGIQGVEEPVAALDGPVEHDLLGRETGLEGPGVLLVGDHLGVAALFPGHFQDPREGVGLHRIGHVRARRPVGGQRPAKIGEVAPQLRLVEDEARGLKRGEVEGERHGYRPS